MNQHPSSTTPSNRLKACRSRRTLAGCPMPRPVRRCSPGPASADRRSNWMRVNAPRDHLPCTSKGRQLQTRPCVATTALDEDIAGVHLLLRKRPSPIRRKADRDQRRRSMSRPCPTTRMRLPINQPQYHRDAEPRAHDRVILQRKVEGPAKAWDPQTPRATPLTPIDDHGDTAPSASAVCRRLGGRCAIQASDAAARRGPFVTAADSQLRRVVRLAQRRRQKSPRPRSRSCREGAAAAPG